MSLVIHGRAGLGKTPVAMSMMAEVATKEQETMPNAAYFIKVGTLDSLRDAFRGNYVKPNVPILFDDLTLMHTAAHQRGGLALEELKHLFEVREGSGLQARFKDFNFCANTPKIFTSNAMNPSEFHHNLPSDVWTMSPERRRGLPPNVQAAFKRACFALVEHSLVPLEVQESHNKARRLGALRR